MSELLTTDEETLRRIIKDEVWKAMNILQAFENFTGVQLSKPPRQKKFPDAYGIEKKVLETVNAHPEGMHTFQVAEILGPTLPDLQGYKLNSTVSDALSRLYKKALVLRFGDRGGDGYVFKPMSALRVDAPNPPEKPDSSPKQDQDEQEHRRAQAVHRRIDGIPW